MIHSAIGESIASRLSVNEAWREKMITFVDSDALKDWLKSKEECEEVLKIYKEMLAKGKDPDYGGHGVSFEVAWLAKDKGCKANALMVDMVLEVSLPPCLKDLDKLPREVELGIKIQLLEEVLADF